MEQENEQPIEELKLELEEPIRPKKVKVVKKVKQEVIIPFRTTKDYSYMDSRIAKKYGAKLVSKTDDEIKYEGKDFIVKLKKI